MQFPIIVAVISQFVILLADTSRNVSDVEQDSFGELSNATTEEEELFYSLEENDKELDAESFSELPIRSSTNDVFEEDEPTTETTATVQSVNSKDAAAREDNIFCDPPPNIERTFPLRIHGLQHPVGTEVTYRCEFGYISRGAAGFRSVCEEVDEKAKWTNPNVVCIPRSCGDPGYVEYADRIGSLFTFPNKVEFSCFEGYKLHGYAARYCQPSGEWSGKAPTCEQILCDFPSAPENGRVRYSSRHYGTELRYECNKGFALKNHQPRFCNENGTWSSNDPVCIEARCDVPGTPEHGSVQVPHNPNVDSIALFTCDEGYTVVGNAVSKCLATGQWTFPPPKCLSSCVLPPVSDGRIGRYETIATSWRKPRLEFVEHPVGTAVKHGETATVVCNEGFVAAEIAKTPGEGSSVSEEVVCEGGKWSKELECKSTSCLGDPPPIENGYPIVRYQMHSHIIYYKCDDYSYKYQTGHVQCNYGTWKGYTPICKDGRCFLNQLNEPGLVKPKVEFILHEKGFAASCIKGYRVTSRWKTVSCFKAKWNVPKGICIEDRCSGEPPPIEHGKPRLFSREPNSEVEYECDESFELKGDSTVQCVAGEWKGQLPNCEDISTTTDAPTTKSAKVTQSRQGETTTAIDIFNVTPRLSAVEQPISKEPENCFCTFEYEGTDLEAYVGRVKLHNGSPVKKGDTAILSCRDRRTRLTWRNGLRVSGEANWTCDVCQRWQASYFPYCEPHYRGDSYIVLNSKLKLVPGGDVEVLPQERLQILCINWDVNYPRWSPGHFTVIYKLTETNQRNDVYATFLDIPEFQPELAGEYQCFTTDPYDHHTFRAAKLHLRASVNDVRCPDLESNDSFIVYSDDRKVNSIAQYFCKKTRQFIAGTDSKTCLENGKWSHADITCIDVTCPGFPVSSGLEVSYTIERKVGSIATFHCSPPAILTGRSITECLEGGTWAHPQPMCQENEIQCPRIDGRSVLIINYSNRRKVKSNARFSCKNSKQKMVGSNIRTCLEDGEWSAKTPTCVDITCPEIVITRGLQVTYADKRKAGSLATFSCEGSDDLIGKRFSSCLYNGSWNSPQPICKNNTCPKIVVTRGLQVTYSDERRAGSSATFSCEGSDTLVGSIVSTCGYSGNWRSPQPICKVPEMHCPLIDERHIFNIVYSNDRKVNSTAYFSCKDANHNIIDADAKTCLPTGEWAGPDPACVAPGCLMHDLTEILPEAVVPDMTGVKGELLPVGSELQLLCDGDMVLTGNAKATCGQLGSWKLGKPQCVLGCRLNIDDSSHLIINPSKQYYRVGESAILSCEPGYSLTTEVERVMCMGSSWSDPIPNCKDST